MRMKKPRYRCWVRDGETVTSWTAESLRTAFADVKARVYESGSEGGVESLDPGRPFEAVFSKENNKLTKTVF